MSKVATARKSVKRTLPKSPTGIQGLDEITGGGLPTGRPTLICGSAGCGKTLMGLEFLVKGAMQHNEPGVFMAFEETAEELAENVRSLGFDLDGLIEQKKLAVDFVLVDRSGIEETGEYDLEGLFIRLGHAIDSIGAKRVVLDTLETLFAGLSNVSVLRSELRRLFRWLKEKGVTAIITAERGDGSLTRHGLEEYVSDCVITLDHRVTDQVSTRRIRVVKYRGSSHGTNEYPFLIDERGIDVLPFTSVALNYEASHERISSGLPRLDAMLGGTGFYRGTSILVSGTAGVGKTSLAATFVEATCKRGETAIYFSFEESMKQVIRNMRSIGIDLEPWVKKGLLQFHSTRPTFCGLETHLAAMYKTIRDCKPAVVVVDPISSFVSVGTVGDMKATMMRLVDFLKASGITGFFTSLAHDQAAVDADQGISSLIDTWLLLRDIELNGERNRGLSILKSRGMPHSNQIREFTLSNQGIQLSDVYLGPDGVLTGSSRLAQESRETAAGLRKTEEIGHIQRTLERKRIVMEAQISVLRADHDAEEEELRRKEGQDQERENRLSEDREAMGSSRQADQVQPSNGTKSKGSRK